MRNQIITTAPWILLFAGVALGQIPPSSSGDWPSRSVDCLSTPSGQLGEVSLILIACFEEAERQLNNVMEPGPPPNEGFDIALIKLHRQVTRKTATALRQGIRTLVREGSEEDREALKKFESDVVEAMVLEEAALTIRAMQVAPQDKGSKDKGKEVQDSIKKIIKEVIGKPLVPEWVGKAFEVIDELVMLFVKT
jgi:hypothetical protein